MRTRLNGSHAHGRHRDDGGCGRDQAADLFEFLVARLVALRSRLTGLHYVDYGFAPRPESLLAHPEVLQLAAVDRDP